MESTNSRQAILAAAKRLFVVQGFRAISKRQIAHEVGISKAAIYYHFEDKEKLFIVILESYLADLASLIDGAGQSGQSWRAEIRAIVVRILAQQLNNAPSYAWRVRSSTI